MRRTAVNSSINHKIIIIISFVLYSYTRNSAKNTNNVRNCWATISHFTHKRNRLWFCLAVFERTVHARERRTTNDNEHRTIHLILCGNLFTSISCSFFRLFFFQFQIQNSLSIVVAYPIECNRIDCTHFYWKRARHCVCVCACYCAMTSQTVPLVVYSVLKVTECAQSTTCIQTTKIEMKKNNRKSKQFYLRRGEITINALVNMSNCRCSLFVLHCLETCRFAANSPSIAHTLTNAQPDWRTVCIHLSNGEHFSVFFFAFKIYIFHARPIHFDNINKTNETQTNRPRGIDSTSCCAPSFELTCGHPCRADIYVLCVHFSVRFYYSHKRTVKWHWI